MLLWLSLLIKRIHLQSESYVKGVINLNMHNQQLLCFPVSFVFSVLKYCNPLVFPCSSPWGRQGKGKIANNIFIIWEFSYTLLLSLPSVYGCG